VLNSLILFLKNEIICEKLKLFSALSNININTKRITMIILSIFALHTGGNPSWMGAARGLPIRTPRPGDTINIGDLTVTGETPAEQRSSFKLQLSKLPEWRKADTIFFKPERFARWHEELKAEEAEAQAITL
jgi:hypothetical protein